MQPDCTTPPLKTCTKCGREHPATLEYFHASAASKLQAWCKECMAAYNAAYYAEHAEHLKDRRRAHHAEHREESRASHRAWYAAHREERAEYNRSWLAEHREERADYKAAHYAEHRDEILAHHAAHNAGHREEIAAYRADHREESAEYRRVYYAEHREEKAAYGAAYRAEHIEAMRVRDAAYRAEHREEKAACTRNRRARQQGNGGTHTAADIRAQYARQKGICFWCPEKVGDTYHVDHVVPVILGGSNGPENLVISCPTCNLSKHAQHPMDFCGRLL